MPPTVGRPSGADVYPVTYINPVIQQIRVDYDVDHVPTNNPVTKSTPSFNSIQINGPSQLWEQFGTQFGFVNMKITKANLSSGVSAVPGFPSYAEVGVNGLWVVLQIGVTLTRVPRNIYDALNLVEGAFAAVIV